MSEATTIFCERGLRVAGLHGLVAPESRTAEFLVSECDGGYRLAMDPLANVIRGYDIFAVTRAAQAPVYLLAGEHDRMGTPEGMRKLDAPLTILPGLGHSAHVEAPETFWQAIEGLVVG